MEGIGALPFRLKADGQATDTDAQQHNNNVENEPQDSPEDQEALRSLYGALDSFRYVGNYTSTLSFLCFSRRPRTSSPR